MKLLVVSPTPSHPPTAGNRSRILSLTRALGKSFDTMTLLYYSREGLDRKSYAEMKSFWDSIYVVPYNHAARVKHTSGSNLDSWISAELSTTFLKLIRAQQFDCVLINYIVLSGLAELVPTEALTILDTHDVFTDRDALLRSMGIRNDFFWTTREQEAQALQRVKIVLAIQERDAEYFSSLGGSVLTVGHLLTVQNCTKTMVSDQEPIKFGFFGSTNKINEHSLLTLIKHWSSSKPPPGSLVIAGRICNSSSIQRAAANSQVVALMGALDDPKTFYESVDVCLNPTELGTGLKIKSIEALSYRKPLLSTREGTVGLDSTWPFHDVTTTGELLQLCQRYSADSSFRMEVQGASEAVFDAYCAKVHQQLSQLSAKITSKT